MRAPETIDPMFRPAGVKPMSPGAPVQPAAVNPSSPTPPESQPRDGRNPRPAPTLTQDPPAKAPSLVPDPPAKTESPMPKMPSLELPPLTGSTDAAPPNPKGPMVPSAAPMPAPPSSESGAGAPPSSPVVPTQMEPKKPTGANDLPPLVLPPEGPGGRSGVIPMTSTSQSSPLTGAVKVQVFTTLGNANAGGTRKVGFFNHTEKDIQLVIEGRAVTLPRKTYIHAEVPQAFQWRYDGHPTQTAQVPDGAAGLDLLFRN